MKLMTVLSFISVISLAGCSATPNFWPFAEGSDERSTVPANSIEYQCAGNKKFYVRMIDKGDAAWVILKDREVSLPKVAGEGERYSNGVSTLTIKDGEARLDESATSAYTECKKPEKKN
jgi:membrane-bound inhibitor of C-type lysozyme